MNKEETHKHALKCEKTGLKPISAYTPIRLVAWKVGSGLQNSLQEDIVINHPVTQTTLALSSSPDSDVVVPELASATVFVRVQGEENAEATLILHAADGKERRVQCKMNEAVDLGPLRWMLSRRGFSQPVAAGYFHDAHNCNESTEKPFDHGEYLRELIRWLAKPMGKNLELRVSLQDFLGLTVQHTAAKNGLLVLAQKSDTTRRPTDEFANAYAYTLISSFGLEPGEVEKLWDKMPPSLPEEILRHKARILLPEEMRPRVNNDSTVFIRGIRSLVGFPVLAEDRLVAVFYVGFDNLLRQLSPELQSVLEAAADLLGIVIQRADLREQLECEKLLSAASGIEHVLPSGRLMVGRSPKLIDVYKTIGRLAPVDVPVLILGETGTGKELAAKEIHRLSPRAKKPFVVVNAAALPDSLVESELFGHKKGSFTGALSDRIGLVEQAGGGTLFIDEIGELPLPIQAKLLRVLQERSVTRIGEAATRPVDFRLVCATHRDLEDMVSKSSFREDLYYRIAGASIRMPALRDRPEDIISLANFFRKRFAEKHGLIEKDWSAEALIALENHIWTGNIRELENVVSRAFVMAEGSTIRTNDLGFSPLKSENHAGDSVESYNKEYLPQESLEIARDNWMKTFLQKALKRHNSKRGDTAKALGIGERTLFRYIEQFDIRDE
jgi:DNA-binding NtrC family response regulator